MIKEAIVNYLKSRLCHNYHEVESLKQTIARLEYELGKEKIVSAFYLDGLEKATEELDRMKEEREGLMKRPSDD